LQTADCGLHRVTMDDSCPTSQTPSAAAVATASRSLQLQSHAGVIALDLPTMKRELFVKCGQCQQRGLAQSYKWIAEISHALK
jgi:hypothetical protein